VFEVLATLAADTGHVPFLAPVPDEPRLPL
jgi:hypothetical protein